MLKVLIFLISFCIGFGWQSLQRPVIHIYMDMATTPALLQMTDFINQPAQDKKIIAWRRYPNRNKYVDLKSQNTEQIDLPESEVLNVQTMHKINEFITRLYKENPNSDYIIHSNIWWGQLLVPVLRIIPKERIKHLCLYEDGLSNTAFSRITYTNRQSNQTTYAGDLREAIAGEKPYHHNMMFSFHKIYPTTYYISFLDYMKGDAQFNDFLAYLKGSDIEPIDINEIARTLTDSQKEKLYALLNFDRAAYEKQIKGKKVDFFALRGIFSTQAEQVRTVTHLYKNRPDDRVLVIKEHPYLKKDTMAENIQKMLPNVVVFPREQPFEILLFANLMPDTVSGYPSSIFFSVPDDKILYYVTTTRDSYLNFLKILNKIPDEKIIQSMKDSK